VVTDTGETEAMVIMVDIGGMEGMDIAEIGITAIVIGVVVTGMAVVVMAEIGITAIVIGVVITTIGVVVTGMAVVVIARIITIIVGITAIGIKNSFTKISQLHQY
jgi:hypothetical protein